MYDTIDQAYMRLRNTWLRHGDKLVQVWKVSEKRGKIHLHVADIYGLKLEETTPLDDPTLIFEYPELGYFNDIPRLVCAYMSKTPKRIQRQGLVLNDIHANGVDIMLTDAALLSAQDCVFNRYPAIAAVMEMLKETAGEVAFCKDYAIEKEELGPVYLRHRGVKVGWWSEGIHKPVTLGTKYSYLLENLKHKHGVDANVQIKH